MSASILIVEDDDMIREMMDVILTQAGYNVSLAAGGEAALDLLKRSRFKLVLLDVHMPRVSGLDVLKTMQALGRTMPPTVMVTANRNAETVGEAMQLGCVGYVAKPFTPDVLRARVRSALAGPQTPASDKTVYV
ncbi:MAG: response regulator [Brevundimonas sp.]|nr:MAG: response regulator [Brevundimonas sp.]